MIPQRRISKQILVGRVPVGGGAPVSVQSMTNTDSADAAATLAQIRELAAAGGEIVRVAILDGKAVAALPEILAGTPIPVIADIHFDHRLALAAIRAGVHGIRLNPGNIGSAAAVQAVAEAAGGAGIPIRVGANAGSLPKGLLAAKLAAGMPRGEAVAEALVEAALAQVKLLEQYAFTALKVSLKSSSAPVTVAACRKFAARSDYPLHLGITEAGPAYRGVIKSAAGIGALLLDGIGDTIRVSLSAPPVEEIRAGLAILEAVGLREARPELVSCPTCGRTAWNLLAMVARVDDLIAKIKSSGRKIGMKKVAVMGCEVNGPAEAADADIGIVGGNRAGKLLLFRQGAEPILYPAEEAFQRLKQALLESCR